MWREWSFAGLCVLAGLIATTGATVAKPVKTSLADLEQLVIREPEEAGFTIAPMGYIRFCITYRNVCTAERATKMELSPKRADELEAVNSAVNRKIRPQPDRPGEDIWSLDATAGDCDDYAVQKRKALLDLGWPMGSLALATARTPAGEPHLVLLVRTTMGHLVLDNLRPDIVPMFRTGYRWLAMQSATNSAYWVDFHLGPTQVAVAPPRLRLTFENTPVAEVFELRGMISAMN